MRNRVLVGGLSMLEIKAGGRSLPGPFNMTEGAPLFENPAHLLWADEILVPSSAFDDAGNLCLFSSECRGPAMDFLRDLVNTTWNTLKEKRIVTRLQFDPVVIEAYERARERVAERIRALPKEGDTDTGPTGMAVIKPRGAHEDLIIEGEFYCPNIMNSIIAALVCCRFLDANWLMPPRNRPAVNWLLGGDDALQDRTVATASSLQALCDLFVPSVPLFPPLWTCHDVECDQQEMCVQKLGPQWRDSAAKATYQLLEMRDADEMWSLRHLIGSCTSELRRRGTSSDIDEAKRLLLEKNLEAQRALARTFPAIERWANVTMMCSLPISLAALACGQNELALAGATIAGASEILTRGAKLLRERYAWVTFVEHLSSVHHAN